MFTLDKQGDANDAICIPKTYFVANKAKSRISKRVLQKKQSPQNFPKNEHLLTPDT